MALTLLGRLAFLAGTLAQWLAPRPPPQQWRVLATCSYGAVRIHDRGTVFVDGAP